MENSSMGNSLGNGSARMREVLSNLRDNVVNAWKSGERRSLPRNLNRINSANGRMNFSRINSASGSRSLVGSMSRANSATSRGSQSRHGWLNIAGGVRNFAEDIAAAMKAGDGGLGSALVANSSLLMEEDDDDDDDDDDGIELKMASLPDDAGSSEARDFDT